MRWLAGLAALATLLLGGCERGQPYQQKGGAWRFEKEPVDVPAGEKLTPLNTRFAKTATRAFFRATPIPEADAASFQALDEHYAKDARQVVFCETYRDGRDYFTTLRVKIGVMKLADPATFVVLGQGYAKDRARVFDDGTAFEVADVASFQPLDFGYARDKVSGYYMRYPMAGSDGASFVAVDSYYSKDARQVFYSRPNYGDGQQRLAPTSLPLKGADPASFVGLDFGYAKDAGRVYHRGAVLAGADPASFTTGMESAVDARDKTGGYKDGKRVAAP